MGISGLFRTAITLVFFLLLWSCGGLGVSNRQANADPRPGATVSTENESVSEVDPVPAKEINRSGYSGRSASSLEDYFNRWLNTPYQLGGNSFNGVDCSGLVHEFFSEYYSKDVPRSTIALYYASEEISSGHAKPGDLVFFQNTYRQGISHVGIVLSGARFVHASNSGVAITEMDDKYWNEHLVGFRRLP